MSSPCACGCAKRVFPSYLLRGQSLAIEIDDEDILLFSCVACVATLATKPSLEPRVQTALQRTLLLGAKLSGSGSDPRRKALEILGVQLPPLQRPKRKRSLNLRSIGEQ